MVGALEVAKGVDEFGRPTMCGSEPTLPTTSTAFVWSGNIGDWASTGM